MKRVLELLKELRDVSELTQTKKVELCDQLDNELCSQGFSCEWEDDYLFYKKENTSFAIHGYGEYSKFKSMHKVTCCHEYKDNGKWVALESVDEFISYFENFEIEIINLTPHKIMLLNEKYDLLQVIESSGVARATEKKEVVSELGGVKLYKTTFEDVQGLPEPSENIVYVVSRIILDACKDRTDLVTTSQIVRKDAEGNYSNHPFAKGDIVGCQAFSL